MPDDVRKGKGIKVNGSRSISNATPNVFYKSMWPRKLQQHFISEEKNDS